METQSASSPRILNDRYEILRPLGQGGMGAVYLVYDRQEQREVALKSFPPAARRVEDLAHFEHEFLTLSRLRNPNVAEVYDFGVIEGTQDVFFTSEFIDGQDLLVVSEGLSEQELAPLIAQACRGLEYIHSREIIHYDVKPSNLMVTKVDGEQQVKLIDFGLAAQRVDSSLGIIKGTVSYLAPEVARHLPVDRRADLYSLGVTLYHCLTRELPFSGETNLDVVRRVVSEEPPDPYDCRPDLTPGVRDLILRLLSKDPGRRMQSGNEVIRELGRIYGQDYRTQPREESLNFVVSGGFFGRDDEFQLLTEAFDGICSWREADDPISELPPVFSDRHASPSQESDGFVETSSGGFILELESGEFDLGSARLDAVSAEATPTTPVAAPAGASDLPHVVLVSGEVGVGKSRLLREFKTYAQLRRVTVVEGHTGRQGGAYAAFADVFRGILALWGGKDASDGPLRPRQNDPLRRRLLQRYGAELARLIPELDDSVLPVGRRAQLAPEQEELRLLDSLAQFLIGYSRARPLVILLHELENADRETLELLRYLVRNLNLIRSAQSLSRFTGDARTLRLLVIGTYRSSEVAPQLREVLDDLEAETTVHPLRLGPLTSAQTYTLIESMLGVGSEPRALAETIYAEAKGNPYFTVELMRSLAEKGILARRDGQWSADLQAPGALQMPNSVADVILERVHRTTPEEQAPLQALAVLGRPSTIHELTALLQDDARTIIARLAALERRQVLHSETSADGTRRYDYIHELAGQAIYTAMDPGQRVDLHAACGDYLEGRADHGSLDPGELVRHFTAAGDRARALDYGMRAGDEACSMHANHKALRFFRDALSLLPVGSARWRKLLVRTGDLLALTGQYDQAAQVYRRFLAPELETSLTPLERVEACRRLGEVLELRGDYDGALDALSEGSACAYSADGLHGASAALFAATASIYYQTGRYADAIGFCEVGLRQLVGSSEGAESARVRTVLGRSRVALGELSEGAREFERALAIHRRLANEVGMAEALRDLGHVALEQGQPEESVTRFERSLERETALGHAGGVALASRQLAEAYRRQSQFERATPLLRRALNIHQKTGNRAEAVRTLLLLGRSCASVGEYQEATQHLQDARKESAELGLLAEAAQALNAEAHMLLDLGAVDRAAKLANEALRQASLHGDVPRQRAVAFEALARVHFLSEDLDASEQFHHQAQALFRKQEDTDGVLRTTLGVLAIFLERNDEVLTRATLDALEPESGQSAPTRARLLLFRARAALRFGVDLGGVHLGHLERAAAVASRCRDRQLAWQIAATRGAVLARLNNPEGGLESYVEAMSAIRRLLEVIPNTLRNSFLSLPACVACREEFSLLRKKQAGENP